jgi:hypothetical protein
LVSVSVLALTNRNFGTFGFGSNLSFGRSPMTITHPDLKTQAFNSTDLPVKRLDFGTKITFTILLLSLIFLNSNQN